MTTFASNEFITFPLYNGVGSVDCKQPAPDQLCEKGAREVPLPVMMSGVVGGDGEGRWATRAATLGFDLI